MSSIRLIAIPSLGRLSALALVTLVACGGDSSSNSDGGTGSGADAGPTGSDAAPPADAAPSSADAGPGEAECEFLGCQDDHGRTCDDDPLVVDCSEFGATCGDFTDTESGAPFQWCDCGQLEESEGFCLDGRLGITCLGGLGGLSDCGPGMQCVERPEGPFGIGCECNDFADGICPGVSCGGDPDCKTCTPECDARECGDNGCGGSCGACETGSTCNPDGTCEDICIPDCAGKECGDDGCGGTCGTCDGECGSDGQCEGTCVPDCSGAECGSDGCGGSCGTCTGDLSCNLDGRCDCSFFDTVTYQFTLAPTADWSEIFGVEVTARHINVDGSEAQADSTLLCDRDSCPGGERTTTWSKIFLGCRERVRVTLTYHVLFAGSCEVEEIVEGTPQIVIPAPTLDGEGGCTAGPIAGLGARAQGRPGPSSISRKLVPATRPSR